MIRIIPILTTVVVFLLVFGCGQSKDTGESDNNSQSTGQQKQSSKQESSSEAAGQANETGKEASNQPPEGRSPEEVLTLQYEYINRGDFEQAYALFAEQSRGEVSLGQYRTFFEDNAPYSVTDYSFSAPQAQGDSATVDATFTANSAGGVEQLQRTQRFVRENGEWRVVMRPEQVAAFAANSAVGAEKKEEIEEPTVDDEVADLVEQVDDTPINADGRSDVLAESAVDPQNARSNNAQAIAAVETYLTEALINMDRRWTNWFINRAGLNEPMVSYEVITPTESRRSNCKAPDGSNTIVTSDTPNAFYCSADALQPGFLGTVYLPAETMLKMWNGDIFGKQSRQAGDFAAAAIVAHEFGHHAQDEILLQANLTTPPQGKNKELIADCFAGNWTADLFYQGGLQGSDFEEAVRALEAIGDRNPGGGHGTPEERKVAFTLGYYNLDGQGGTPGSPEICIQYYWR